MREKCLEALRVLAPRRAAGPELGPHGQGHLGRTARHERELGGLVEQLVEADPEEVEVHDLDDGTHAGHRGTDGEPDDRSLRDRRVPDTVAEARAQPAGQAEDVASLADVDTGEKDALVGSELGLQGAAHGVHRPVGGLATHGRGGGSVGVSGTTARRPHHEVEE